MGHTHEGAGEIDFTVSGHIVRIDSDEPQLFMHAHRKFGTWMPASGHIELNELPFEAVQREISEETGYQSSQLSIYQPKIRIKSLNGARLQPQNIQINNHPIPDPSVENHSHSDIGFVFATSEAPSGSPDEGESDIFATFSLEDLNNLPENEILDNVRTIGIFILESIIDEWVLVPLSEFED